MIIFDLKCEPDGHVFEAWFASSAAFEEQQGRGLVACPLCGSGRISKAPMAPAVAAKGNSGGGLARSASSSEAKALLAAAAALQKKLLAGSESLGDRFAAEARAIHLGEADARPIHGEATLAEAESLIDEGVPIAPLPFPVVPPGEEN
ncbi:MAG TPA: DUF1178 family protein [Allosphingosinicella sp.]